MMAAGLRREEAASIQFTDIIKQDKRYVLELPYAIIRITTPLLSSSSQQDVAQFAY